MTNGKANAKLKIDRTKYGIKYKSKNFIKNIGDKMIYDEFDLEVNTLSTLSKKYKMDIYTISFLISTLWIGPFGLRC